MVIRKQLFFSNIPFLTAFAFLAIGLCCLVITSHAPLGDFGNYYYGSKLLLDGKFNEQVYSDIHYFNETIADYGQTHFFGNYIPVPPFTALFYTPFTIFSPQLAKQLFNCLGLLLFCYSLYQLLIYLDLKGKFSLFVPLVFLYPLFNNIYQGQTYLLVTALLLVALTSMLQGKIILPALAIAVCICLKLFPVIFLLYFILEKKYRLLFVTSFFTVVLYCLPGLFLGFENIFHYITEILPRLANNDVVGKYYAGNQSLHTVLLDLFSYDALNNTSVITDNTLLATLFYSIFTGTIIGFLVAGKTCGPFRYFILYIGAAVLLSKYTTSYMLILLVPFLLSFTSVANKKNRYILFVLTFFIVSIPVTTLLGSVFLIKYSRLWGLLFLFFACMSINGIRPKALVILIIATLSFVFSFIQTEKKSSEYFSIQGQQGILYDLNMKEDTLQLLSTLGMKDTIESFKLNSHGVITDDLVLKNNKLYYKSNLVLESKDNKKKPFLLNDSLLVFMSDADQAVGFYKLRYIPVKELKHQ